MANDVETATILPILKATGMTVHLMLDGSIFMRDKRSRAKLTKQQVKYRLHQYYAEEDKRHEDDPDNTQPGL